MFGCVLLLLPGQLEVQEEDYLDSLCGIGVETDEERRDEEGDDEDYHYDEDRGRGLQEKTKGCHKASEEEVGANAIGSAD